MPGARRPSIEGVSSDQMRFVPWVGEEPGLELALELGSGRVGTWRAENIDAYEVSAGRNGGAARAVEEVQELSHRARRALAESNDHRRSLLLLSAFLCFTLARRRTKRLGADPFRKRRELPLRPSSHGDAKIMRAHYSSVPFSRAAALSHDDLLAARARQRGIRLRTHDHFTLKEVLDRPQRDGAFLKRGSADSALSGE
jgi:hypothetical protein